MKHPFERLLDFSLPQHQTVRLILCFYILLCGNVCLAQDKTRLSILFAGDIMGHDSQIVSAYSPATKRYDYTSCYQYVKPYIQSVDLAIANLELTLAGPPYKGYPTFSSPDQLAMTLKEVGFDALVTANNHSCDKGRLGIERTIEMLDSVKMEHTGTFVDEASRLNDYPLLLKKNGFSLALLNYTYGTNGIAVPKPNIVNLIDTLQMARDIIKAKNVNPDFVIAFVHWGSEYQSQPNGFQKTIANFLFRKGVQIIIGAHPHVIQPMKFNYEKQQLVVYSLGNFVSGQRDRYKNGGAMVRLELSKILNDSTENASIDSVSYLLEYVHRDAQNKYVILPVPDFEKDSMEVLNGTLPKEQFKTFIDDSRSLLTSHNVNIHEFKKSSLTLMYRVKVRRPTYVDSREDELKKLETTYGVEVIEQGNGWVDYYLGNFTNQISAQKILDEISARIECSCSIEVFAR